MLSAELNANLVLSQAGGGLKKMFQSISPGCVPAGEGLTLVEAGSNLQIKSAL